MEEKTVRIVESWTRDLGLPEHWLSGEIYNAARPFPCHEDKTGEFVHGVFYGVIWPEEEYADGYRKRAIALDAHRLVFVTRETVEEWGRCYCEDNGLEYADYEYDDIVRSYLNHAE